jgi:hypothetical protein
MKASELKSEIGNMTKTPAGWDGGRKAKQHAKKIVQDFSLFCSLKLIALWQFVFFFQACTEM